AMALIVDGQRVLDVGTGTGVAARAAAASGAHAFGVDPSIPMLVEARRAGGDPRYAGAEAIDLPFRDGTFDVVLASFALAGFQKYDTALFDLLRVLKRGGRMAVCTWGPGDDEFSGTWESVAEEFAEHEILMDARQRAMPWRERFSDPNRLKDALHESGLRNLQVERREYHFEIRADDYLAAKEIETLGRFLHQMLGEDLWQRFRQRVAAVFAERFPLEFNDFREAVLAVGSKEANA
ncbi:MAG TPA: methyltransferase domain-containing protein, partial [Actinomycetota bacterium]|nr:methyltransferase domain-containing protein [Actinomycetota bacterium]